MHSATALILASTLLTMGGVAIAAPPAPRLVATAGVAGLARAGRWMPVSILLETGPADLVGELVVTWGDGVVTRAVRASASSRVRYELYARARDPRETVHVALRTGDGQMAEADAAVTLAPVTSTITLCLVSAGSSSETADDCTATLPAASVPSSPRGLDVADAVVWHGPDADLTSVQRQALDTWRAYRALMSDVRLSALPHARPLAVSTGAAARSLWVVGAGGALYVLLLAAVPSWTGRTKSTARRFYGAVAAVCGIGCAGALAAGRIGPAASVRVDQASTLTQLPSRSVSVVTGRGRAEFPSFDPFALTADAADLSLTVDAYPGRTAALDDEGNATLAGLQALGHGVTFDVDGFVPVAPLAMTRNGARVRVVNRSATGLRNCVFINGGATDAPRTLAAGAAFDLPEVDPGDNAVVSCVADAPAVMFREARRRVTSYGATVVNAYLPPSPSTPEVAR